MNNPAPPQPSIEQLQVYHIESLAAAIVIVGTQYLTTDTESYKIALAILQRSTRSCAIQILNRTVVSSLLQSPYQKGIMKLLDSIHRRLQDRQHLQVTELQDKAVRLFLSGADGKPNPEAQAAFCQLVNPSSHPIILPNTNNTNTASSNVRIAGAEATIKTPTKVVDASATVERNATTSVEKSTSVTDAAHHTPTQGSSSISKKNLTVSILLHHSIMCNGCSNVECAQMKHVLECNGCNLCFEWKWITHHYAICANCPLCSKLKYHQTVIRFNKSPRSDFSLQQQQQVKVQQEQEKEMISSPETVPQCHQDKVVVTPSTVSPHQQPQQPQEQVVAVAASNREECSRPMKKRRVSMDARFGRSGSF
jgi:hypothetical protein